MSLINLDRQASARRPRRRWSTNTLFLIMAVAAVVAVVGGMLVVIVNTPAAPAPAPTPPDFHRVELRIDGDGVGQLARVWDAAGERDVDTFGTSLAVVSPRAVLYTVQAGAGQSATCVILLDGTEVARELAEPLTVATCAWVAER